MNHIRDRFHFFAVLCLSVSDTQIVKAAIGAISGLRRPAPPGIMIEAAKQEYAFTSPHDDPNAWDLQLADAFGTRSISIMRVFTMQLAALCEQVYDPHASVWKPNEAQLNAILAVVNSVRPKNESEAMLAAQMAAVHLMTMRVSEQALKGWVDTRAASVAGKLARTYAMQLDALGKLRGKGSSSRQKITVRHEKHVHQHQHIHVEGGGPDFGGQPHAPMDDGPNKNGGRIALPGENAGGQIVPIRCCDGQERLPDARRR